MLDWAVPESVHATGAQRWRGRILGAVLFGLVAFGIIGYFPTVWLALQHGAYGVVVIDTIGYGIMFAALLARRAPYRSRAWVAVLLPGIMGIYFLYLSGFVASGFLWVMVVPILSAVLLDLRSSIWILAGTAATLVIMGVMVARGIPPWVANTPAALDMWVVQSISLMMLASLTSLSIAVLSDGLEREGTGRVSAEREREQLADAVEQSGGVILLVDRDATVRYANAAARQLVSGTKGSLIGASLADWLTTDESTSKGTANVAGRFPMWTDVLNGTAWSGTFHTVDGIAQPRILAGTLSPVRDDADVVQFGLAALRDVTHERELEERLRQAGKLQAIGTLVGGIAHDFNNLLQPIVLNADALTTRLAGDPTGQQLVADILQCADRGRALIRRILTFTRDAQLQRAPTDMHTVVEDTTRLIRASVRPDVVVTIEHNEPATIVADPSELQQLLLNLAMNAAYAMPNGGTMTLSSQIVPVNADTLLTAAFPAESRVARLTVTDTGVGMDPGTLARAFEPFFTTKPPGEGTGLGLATTHGTVTVLGGIVVPTSVPGAGTVMRLFLPLATTPARASRAVRTPSDGQFNRRILLVDDEAAVRRAATRLLTNAGATVSVCDDPRQVLPTLQAASLPFDCVVTDLSMPHLNGLQLAAAVRAEFPNLPIVLTTGFLDHQDLLRAPSVGISQVVPKPFTLAQLREAIEQATADHA